MFDVGFIELLLVMVLSLLVLGPEKLPGAVRKAGFWLGRMRAIVSSIKDSVDQEMAAVDEVVEETRSEVDAAVNVSSEPRQDEQS